MLNKYTSIYRVRVSPVTTLLFFKYVTLYMACLSFLSFVACKTAKIRPSSDPVIGEDMFFTRSHVQMKALHVKLYSLRSLVREPSLVNPDPNETLLEK